MAWLMLTLYRTLNCPRCDSIQGVLEEMVLAHKVVLVRSQADLTGLPDGCRPPLLVNEGKARQGSEAITKHLEELEKFKNLWYKHQSDACYCDEQGNVE